MAGYPEVDFAEALDEVWTLLKPTISKDAAEVLFQKHPVLWEIDQFGPNGPVGLGPGRMGGHCIGPADAEGNLDEA